MIVLALYCGRATDGCRRRAVVLGQYAGIAAILAVARGYLEGTLLCRFDHLASDCKVMGFEIDRRLASSEAG